MPAAKAGPKTLTLVELQLRRLFPRLNTANLAFRNDGRLDFVVAQNGAATKLYRNTHAKPGLRVRLASPTPNPCAVGAVVRLLGGESAAPAREVRIGTGYWSQDSPWPVLDFLGEPDAIEVRWPGGSRPQTPLPPRAREITIHPNGTGDASF